MENKIDGKTKIRMDICIKHPNEIMVLNEEALPQCNECGMWSISKQRGF